MVGLFCRLTKFEVASQLPRKRIRGEVVRVVSRTSPHTPRADNPKPSVASLTAARCKVITCGGRALCTGHWAAGPFWDEIHCGEGGRIDRASCHWVNRWLCLCLFVSVCVDVLSRQIPELGFCFKSGRGARTASAIRRQVGVSILITRSRTRGGGKPVDRAVISVAGAKAGAKAKS